LIAVDVPVSTRSQVGAPGFALLCGPSTVEEEMMPADFPAHRSTERRPARPVPLGLIAALALGIAVVGCASSAKTPQIIYITPSPSPTPVPTPTPEITPSPTPKPTPTPVPSPTIGPCSGSNLTITIQAANGLTWQENSGHQLANFQVKNTGPVPCQVKAKSQPMLLNGDGSILIAGPEAGSAGILMLNPNTTLKTTVQTGNLCAAPPIVAPVRVAFVMSGTGLVIAETTSPTEMGGIPSCQGPATVPSGEIQMTSWAP
jgi:hypothetical protein